MSGGHDQGPVAERLRGPFTGVAPEVKLVVLVGFLVVVGLLPRTSPWPLATAGLVAVVVATLAFVDWRKVLTRFAIEVPLVVLAATYALFGKGPDVVVAGLALSRPGLHAGAAILAKASIGVVMVSAMAACTSVPETLAGLRTLHAPQWFCDLLALAARQLDVLRGEYQRVALAVAVRAGKGGRVGGGARTWAGTRALGALFVRTVERADRLQLAADLRAGRTGRER